MVNVAGSCPMAADASRTVTPRMRVLPGHDRYTASPDRSSVIVIPHSHGADFGAIKGRPFLQFGGRTRMKLLSLMPVFFSSFLVLPGVQLAAQSPDSAAPKAP